MVWWLVSDLCLVGLVGYLLAVWFWLTDGCRVPFVGGFTDLLYFRLRCVFGV